MLSKMRGKADQVCFNLGILFHVIGDESRDRLQSQELVSLVESEVNPLDTHTAKELGRVVERLPRVRSMSRKACISFHATARLSHISAVDRCVSVRHSRTAHRAPS